MNRPLQHQLPYSKDCSRLFAVVSNEPWAMLLDSCGLGGELGRYDIIVARPHTTLITRGDSTEIYRHGSTTSSIDDPFTLLRQYLATDAVTNDLALPFCGGAVGYFGYDLSRRIENIDALAKDDLAIPEMVVGIYDWALVCDHQEQRCQLLSQGHDAATHTLWPQLVSMFEAATAGSFPAPDAPFSACGEVSANMTRDDYCAGFSRIQHYLEEGDCYQVNLAQRFSAAVSGSPWSGYLKLRSNNPAPFGAYLNTPFGQILSSSPERFLRLKGKQVETRPIKGTRPRCRDAIEDQAMVEQLTKSSKDRAENLMIVDLLRNDLGKCCRPGTIRVPQLFNVEHYATVHHLVSVIEGELEQGKDALTLLRSCFPGGSITGAPKLRAMEIIEELEPQRRGVYCGSIGYIGYDGNMDSNIAIRTALHQNGMFHFSAGGGIVRDSVCEDEYQECHDKASGVLRIFDS
ncbi:MAG: aminodeoxychorismate synthase component I [Pseudomonadota bacterium]